MQTELSATVALPAARLHFRVAWLCGIVLFLEGYDIASVGYAVPSLVDAWEIPPSAFTQVLTLGNVGLLVGSVCAGLLGDRLGRKPVIISCVAMFAVFSLLSAFASSPAQLAGLRFLTGLGLGGGLPLGLALVSDFASHVAQGRPVILMTASIPIGFTVGGLLASRLVAIFGWPAIFVAGGVLPLAVVPLLAQWLPESIAQRPERSWHSLPGALFKNGLAPITLLLWVINMLSLLVTHFMLLWVPAILHNNGLSSSRAVLGTTAYGLGVIASPLLTAVVVDRIGIERVLACGMTFGALCFLCIGLFGRQFWLLALALCGAGVGGGCQAGIMSLSAMGYPTAIRSTGAGWALGAGRVGSIAGALLGGMLLALGFRTQKIFLVASIPAFGAALFMSILGRFRRTRSV